MSFSLPVKRHVQDGGLPCFSEGMLEGKDIGDRDTIEGELRYQRLGRSKDKSSLNYLET